MSKFYAVYDKYTNELVDDTIVTSLLEAEAVVRDHVEYQNDPGAYADMQLFVVEMVPVYSVDIDIKTTVDFKTPSKGCLS